MWKNFKQKTKEILNFFKRLSNEKFGTDTEECLQRLENALNSSTESDLQMQVNGQWVSQSLMEAISFDNSEEQLLRICRQTEALRLESIFPKAIHTKMEVLWSGCYSEVFRIKNLNGEDIVLKISLINRLGKDGNIIQTASAVISDVINSKRLSDLKAVPLEMADNYCENFANIKSFLYVWSHRLVFNKSESKERRNPNHKRYQYFISQQTFGGKQLDSVSGLSPTKALSLVLQLIASLAVAENALHFEHRDLHLSNLLIKPSEDNYLNYSIDGHKFRLKINGIKLIIIDTTFARTQMQIDSNDKESMKYFYNDLSNLNLDDYRNQELKKVYLNQKQIATNNWKEFYPKTNTIWLTYCVNRIYQKVEKWSQNHCIPSDSNYSHHLSQLKQIKLRICDSKSAKDFAHVCQLI